MLLQDASYTVDLLQGLRYSDYIGIFFWGAATVLMCFIFFLFIKAREYIYIYYTLFLFFILIYCLTHLMAFPGIDSKVLNYFRGNSLLGEPMALISFAFYVFFAVSLLEIRQQNKKMARFLNTIAISCLGYSILYIFSFNFIFQFEPYLFSVIRLILFSLSIYALIWIYRSIHSPVKFYFIIGSIAYYMGALIASVRYIEIPFPFHQIGNLTSSAYFEIGILLQALFFAMALGKRIVILHEEKLASDQALIEQLRKNHQISLDTNKALEVEVQSRVSELIQVREDLQEKEKERLKADLMNSEIRAKQAQVNPHFIYNSMNALKYMIQQNHNKEAVSYLVRFSRMVRALLEETEEETISLTKEIEYIENYLELEKERFKGFQYSIEIDENIPMNTIPIPPLLLQPLAEQTIWDYLSKSSNEDNLKKLRILVSLREDTIIISIYNEGLTNLSPSAMEDRDGIKLARERIDLFNKQSTKYHIELCSNNMISAGRIGDLFPNLALVYRLKEMDVINLK